MHPSVIARRDEDGQQFEEPEFSPFAGARSWGPCAGWASVHAVCPRVMPHHTVEPGAGVPGDLPPTQLGRQEKERVTPERSPAKISSANPVAAIQNPTSPGTHRSVIFLPFRAGTSFSRRGQDPDRPG
ncbi:hypothetical protein QJS66_21475 [Kocuria rhizophila]|nr:hypothetical protein QJS66_21475 [Kocuria rhizophila]